MPGSLQAVRVVDVTTMVSGPVATRILADQGPEGRLPDRHLSIDLIITSMEPSGPR
jgi:hypothetical protein